MKIGVLTSGGDASGMNTYLYFLNKFLGKKHELVAIELGYRGVLEKLFSSFDEIKLKQAKLDAGTIIKSSRCPEFRTPEGVKKAKKNLKGFDCLIAVGGNGTLRGVKELIEIGVNCIFVPGTIDNDLEESNYSIGFDSAINEACNYVEKVRKTFESFDNSCVVEVMGRECDNIAKEVAEKTHADYLVNSKDLIKPKLFKDIKTNSKKSLIVVLQENIVKPFDFAKELEEKTKRTFRACVVGYIQRGANLTKKEYIMAKAFAEITSDAIRKNLKNQMIVFQNNSVVSKDINI